MKTLRQAVNDYLIMRRGLGLLTSISRRDIKGEALA